MLSKKYHSLLNTWKARLDPRYSHTRCPVCIFLVDVDGNGNMVTHGPNEIPCIGSQRNDEELAEELDRGAPVESVVEPLHTDGEATH
jgi:hypothetical protein